MAFKQMQDATTEDWKKVYDSACDYQKDFPDRVVSILEGFAGVCMGFPVDQLQHSLQTATLAEQDGAPEEIILCALLHDIGKSITTVNHGPIGAEILRKYISDDAYQILYHHQEFQGRFYYAKVNKDPNQYKKFSNQPWFDMAVRFSAWDQQAFNPDLQAKPLEYFKPLIKKYLSDFHMQWKETA